MKYNLVRNGLLRTLTTSGTGNVAFAFNELNKLVDNNLTSSGVSITSSGVLYLEVDLAQRIKVDGIRLYANDLSKKNNIKFYYKNDISDNYTILTTNSGNNYYYTNVPSPSAPRFILTTISGIDIELYEFQVFNDDYIVAFGTDGQLTDIFIDDASLGEYSSIYTIPIYNNNSLDFPVNAYTCVDYTSSGVDFYLELANDINGPYYKLEDGVILQDNKNTSKYIWNMGEFDNTEVNNDYLAVINGASRVFYVDLPLSDPSSSLRCGDNALTWDRFNKKAYIMGLDGNVLKLWEYKYDAGEFNYISDINPSGSPDSNVAVMTYCQVSGTNRIYAITKSIGGFGYVDIDSSPNNWTALPNPPWNFTLDNLDRIGICSDGIRYIYAIAINYGGTGDVERTFIRFDTVSGTWTQLNNDYDGRGSSGGGSSYGQAVSLAYDYDRDYIYAIVSSEELNNFYYVQRYIVDSDVWNTQYINYGASFGSNSGMVVVSYHNNNIYVGLDHLWDNEVFKYHIPTATITKLNVGYKHYNVTQGSYGVHLLAIDGLNNDDSLLIASIDGNLDKLGVYNPYFNNIEGWYTTPIFSINDSNEASYFITVEEDFDLGLISISDDIDGTMYIRSSDIKPENITRIYWCDNDSDDVEVYDAYSGDLIAHDFCNVNNGYYHARNVAINRRNGRIAISYYYQYYYYDYGSYIRVYYNNGNYIDGIGHHNGGYYDYLSTLNFEFDVDNGLWCAGAPGGTYKYFLRRVNNNYDDSSYFYYQDTSFLYDFAVEWEDVGLWYTNTENNTLMHIDYDGTTKHQIILQQPRAICSTEDDGCWVADNSTNKIYRYDKNGQKVDEMNIPEEGIYRMVKDFDDGFWYISSNYSSVGHINDNKQKDLYIDTFTNLARIKAGHKCCIVFSFTNDEVYFIDLNLGLVQTFTTTSTNSRIPGLLSFSYEDYVNYHDLDNIFPDIDRDSVWNNNFEWQEVPKNGYFLPKVRYHQLKYRLVGDAKLDKIILAPAIKTSSIGPNESKNIYTRIKLPAMIDIGSYNSRLKTWWGLK